MGARRPVRSQRHALREELVNDALRKSPGTVRRSSARKIAIPCRPPLEGHPPGVHMCFTVLYVYFVYSTIFILP